MYIYIYKLKGNSLPPSGFHVL